MTNGPTYPNGKFKTIYDYTPAELDKAVEDAVANCKAANVDFYNILRGVDAYMERRARKQAVMSPAERRVRGMLADFTPAEIDRVKQALRDMNEQEPKAK